MPVPSPTQFAVMASRSATFGDRTAVNGGSVGVAAGGTPTPNTLSAGFDTHISVGQVLLAPQVTLAERATTGEIGANTINAPASDVTGPRSAFVAPPAQPVPGTITPGTTAITVASGQSRTLAAGAYGAVTVGGTLNLSGGLYQIQSLSLNDDTQLVALAASTVRVATTVTGLARVHLVTAGTQAAGSLRFIVGGSTSAVTLGNDATVTALIVARGDVRAGDRFIMNGSIAGRDVVVGHDCQIGFASGFGCGSDASCTDNNDCTTDRCGDAACTHTTVANGAACSDGNACTRSDVCRSGVCVGSNPVVCTASDQCHVAGVCSPATGVCSNPNKADGTACSDTNFCTLTDSCQAGVCVGSNPVICTALDPCHDAGACNPASGQCSNPTKADGTACDDGDKCTQNDVCNAGVCGGDNPNNCGNVCFLGDTDGDGVDNCHDLCIHDRLKTDPGICGCGVSEVDRDGDGVPDCKDQCPDDPGAQIRGECGCPSSPAAAGTPCDDGVCRGVFACNGAGQCGTPSQCAPQAGGGCVAKFFDKKYYWFCPGPVGWDAAEAACRGIQTSLAQIDSGAENQFVAHNLLAGAPAWIGGNDKTTVGTWRWATAAANDGDRFWTGDATGQPYFARFNDWTAGTPLGGGPSCASIAVNTQWSSGACGNSAGFVCEVPTDRTIKIDRPRRRFCEVLGIPCTDPPDISQCNTTSTDSFGGLDDATFETNADACDQACANVPVDQQQACADAHCSGPFTVPPGGSTCPAFGAQDVAVCLVTPPAGALQPCSSDAECPGAACGVVQGCPSDQTGPCPASTATTATRYCGTPVPGCPRANDTGFPDLCSEAFLCDGAIAQTTTGFDPGTSDLTPETIDPQKEFPTPDSPSTTEPYPDRSDPCPGGACSFAADLPAHPWCHLDVEDSLSPRPAENPTKKGNSGDVVTFEFDPQLRLDHTLTVGPFGNPTISIGAEAGVAATVHLNLPGVPQFDIHALDAHATLNADQCSVKSDIALKVLGVDFTPILTSQFPPTFPLPLNVPSAAGEAACRTAYNRLRNTGDRAKKALRDALELMRQERLLTNVGHNFDQATFCASLGADNPPAGFPPGDCTKDNPEATINRFIEYYRRTVTGFPAGSGVKSVADAAADLSVQGFNLGVDNFVLYEFEKDEEQTLLDANFLIGPIPVNLELLGTLSYGASVTADFDFNPATVIEQIVAHNGGDTAAPIAFVSVSGTPSAAAGLGMFAGIGFSVDSLKAKIGVEGDLQLGTISVPATAGVGIGLGSTPDTRPPPADMTPDPNGFLTGASLIPAKRYVLDLRYAASLGASVRNILSGNIDGVLKLKIAFFSKKWRQRLLSFNGFCAAAPQDPLLPFPPLAGCDLTLVSLASSSDGADGAFPWGEVRLETPFPELKPYITNAVPLGSSTLDTSRVQQFFYDTLCTCIGPDQKDVNNPDLTRQCARSADCCPAAPTCFHDLQRGGSSCIICRAASETCNGDGDCCSGNICSKVTGVCQAPGSCRDVCTRDQECISTLTCIGGSCGGSGCLK